jgi:hypothetical protein
MMLVPFRTLTRHLNDAMLVQKRERKPETNTPVLALAVKGKREPTQVRKKLERNDIQW